eukprot:scaffold99736_cov61-Phaeocystis_antarctica.AAC.1
MESNLWSVFLIENLQCVLKGEYSANHYTAVPVCLPPHENIMRCKVLLEDADPSACEKCPCSKCRPSRLAGRVDGVVQL